jgi:hypothetical protein
MGGQVVPFPGMPMQPAMVPNPQYAQWQQMAQAWQQEQQQRQQQFLKACDFIKEDASKRYNIDIEADSTIAADEDAEKAARTQFIQAITPFLEMAIPQMQQNPIIAPLIGQLVMFMVRAFPISRQLDDAFENALDQLESMAKQAPPPPPKTTGKSPQEIQAETQIAQGEQQTDLKVQQMRSAADAGKAQADQQSNAIKLMQMYTQQMADQAKLQQEGDQHQAEMALRNREMIGREALEQARMTRIESQNTQGLV